MVLTLIEQCHKYGDIPPSFYEYGGNKYAVSEINMIDGQWILEEQPQEAELPEAEAIFNVNTLKDLELTEDCLLRSEKSQVKLIILKMRFGGLNPF